MLPPHVELITQWPGQASEEVEQLVTVPLETAMNGIPNVTVVRSVSLYGLSDVTLTFADGTDNYFARQQVFERLKRRRFNRGRRSRRSRVTLPAVA